MKKLIAILLCVLILSALTLTVFADNGATDPSDVPSPTGTAAPTETTPHNDNGNTSPKTGTNAAVYVIVLSAALFGVVFSVKKLAKNQY